MKHPSSSTYVSSSFILFPEFAVTVYRNYCCEYRNVQWHPLSFWWCRANSWFILYDNAPAHRSISVQDFLAKKNLTALEYPPYFSDLVPADICQFPLTKSALKVWRFFLLLPSLRMRRKSWKDFYKMASRTASSTLRLLTEVYAWKVGLFWRKCSLNDNTALFFSERKWFREYFEATT